VAAIPGLASQPIEVEQIAQIDSKDMDLAVWSKLARAVARHLARDEVKGIVITHGTDTLEETAYFLQRVLAPCKPVVLVAAMRPATSLQSDGPQNVMDAMVVAREPGARGVLAVLAGKVHGALDVRKVHPYRLDAFGSGDAGIVGHLEAGALRRHRDWPQGEALGVRCLPVAAVDWPKVEIITSHAAATASIVDAVLSIGTEGIVVACSGNGSVHHALEAALMNAQASGVSVLRSTRCLDGTVIDAPESLDVGASAGALTPVQARIELMLRLLAKRAV
jgi:L-asparaginase